MTVQEELKTPTQGLPSTSAEDAQMLEEGNNIPKKRRIPSLILALIVLGAAVVSGIIVSVVFLPNAKKDLVGDWNCTTDNLSSSKISLAIDDTFFEITTKISSTGSVQTEKYTYTVVKTQSKDEKHHYEALLKEVSNTLEREGEKYNSSDKNSANTGFIVNYFDDTLEFEQSGGLVCRRQK